MNPEDKLRIANILPEYNTNVAPIEKDILINTKRADTILDELNDFGVSSLGKMFSDKECKAFLTLLNNKECYNNQTPLQSDGKLIKFKFDQIKFNEPSSPYYCFTPDVTMSFKPIYNLITDSPLNSIINNYLKFSSIPFNCVTWYNQPNKNKHYVHRLHRDFEDFKSLGLMIYWNEINISNGPFTYVKGSHKNFEPIDDNIQKTYLTGSAGSVFLVDSFGLHQGTPLNEGFRVTTSMRFGHEFNHSSVNDGFLLTPSMYDF